MEHSLVRGIAALRWITWVWMAAVQVLARASLEHPAGAAVLVLAALVVTVVTSLRARHGPRAVLAPWLVAAELGVAAALLLGDGFVYDDRHVFTTEQSLAVAWPLAGVLTAGLALGTRGGLAVGVLFGLCRAVSSTLHAPPVPAGEVELGLGLAPVWLLSLVTTTVSYALAGGVAGYASGLLRRAEREVAEAQREVAAARAREEVARTLHDGVLQTLAVVERRSGDEALAGLARRQERELRDYLFGAGGADVVGRGDLGDRLRAAASRFEEVFGLRAQVLVPDDLPGLADEVVSALAGAVGEALTNVGKHADAGRVVVFVEPDDGGVFCSVRDDGVGFDPATTAERVGLTSSIRARMDDVGGTIEIDSAPGRGTEVRLRVRAG